MECVLAHPASASRADDMYDVAKTDDMNLLPPLDAARTDTMNLLPPLDDTDYVQYALGEDGKQPHDNDVY